jgi:hypothetical protein
MLAMHFGPPDPDMRSQDATALGPRYVLCAPWTPHAGERHGSHSDSTARGVGCCARRRAPIAGSSSRQFLYSLSQETHSK